MPQGNNMSDNVLTADLDEIDRLINGCTLCTLGSKRTTAVPGNGSRTSDLMFIGEGPGYYEDQQGLPFVGRAGQLLNEMLATIGLRREDVFVTNMIKCRAPNNRDPSPSNQVLRPLSRQANRAHRPQGYRDPRQVLHREVLPGRADGKLRGTPANWNGITVYPMYHPAAALRNSTIRAALERDFLKLPGLLEAPPATAPSAPPPPEPQTTQLGLLDAPPSQPPADPPEDPVAAPPDETPPDQKQLGLF